MYFFLISQGARILFRIFSLESRPFAGCGCSLARASVRAFCRWIPLAWIFSFGSLCWSCAHKPQTPEPATSQSVVSSPENEEVKVQGSQSTRLIGRIPAGTFGPHLALGTEGRLAVWAESETQRPMWESLLIPSAGGLGAAQHFDQLASGLEDFQVLGLHDGHYLLLSRRHVGDRDVLEAHLLDEAGALVESARAISEASEIIWSEAVAVEQGALITYAVEKPDGATIYSFHYRTSGQFVSPIMLQEDVVAWQVAQRGEHIYLGTVSKEFTNRSVSLMPLDPSARQVHPPVQVAQVERGALDLDVKIGKKGVFYAFSEDRQFEDRIVWGAIDFAGNSRIDPRPLTRPRGNQQLVALGLDTLRDQLLVLWEEPALARQTEREILGSLVDEAERSSPQFSFATGLRDPLLPQVAFDGTVFQFIMEQPPALQVTDGQEEPDQVQIAIASYDPETRATTTRLTRLEQLEGRIADMAWDLSCAAGRCELLVAKSGSPSLVFAARVDLLEEVESQVMSPQTWQQPQMTSVKVLQKVPDLRSLAVVQDATGKLVSWVTDFDTSLPYQRRKTPAKDGRYAPERAHLVTLAVAKDSEESGETTTPQAMKEADVKSYRARSTGGVSLSEAGKNGQRAMGWAALDGEEPQVFVTIIGASGKKIRQKMLTNSPGEISDVRVVRIERGYLVLWLDGRGDVPLIYSLVVNEQLKVIRREKALTVYSENPTGLAVRAVEEGILVVWSDAEGAGKQGHGDLFSLSLDRKSGELISPAHRLFATTPHSHSPALTSALYSGEEAATLVWIESTLQENGLETSMIRRAEVDLSGRVVGAPDDFFFDSLVSSFSVHCEAKHYCDIVFPLITGQRARLWAVSLDQNGTSQTHPLYGLTLPKIQLVTPTLVGTSLYYVDQVEGGQNLLMELKLSRE